MCGILGYSGAFPADAIRRANQRQRHRGPDDLGEFIDAGAGIGLGHVRLSILDLSHLGHQPMCSEDGTVALVFNGEIYNFRELRAELQSRGHCFRSGSDTEVLLHLYLSEGPSMLQRLNGIFSLAFWNARDRSLFIARDGLGVKPLYIAETERGFAFASEIKALLQLVPEARELDVTALHRYLTFLWCPGDGTPLRAVKKLQPGEALTIRAGHVVDRWQWYQLPAARGVAADLTEAQAVLGTAEHLRRAVQRQLVADVPVGAFLSGGLDSSAVVAFAREQAPNLRCFSIESVGGDEAGVTPDLPYARRVATYLGVSLDVVQVDAAQMAADLDYMIRQLDEPLADPAALNVLYISRLARQHGITVLLSGAGGDDLFTGYRRHLAVAYERYWRGLPQIARTSADWMATHLDQRRPLSRRLAKLLSGAHLNGDERLANYFVWTREERLLALYTSETRRRLGSQPAVAPILAFLGTLPASVSPMDRILALEQRFFLADHNLTYTDKMSMAAGVEVRVPFLDTDLVEYAARIPAAAKQRGRQGKAVLKTAMRPYLPDDVIYRAKSGFGAPLRRWMRHELRPLIADVLSSESLRSRGLFEPAPVQRLIEQNQRGEVDAAYALLSLIAIEVWCRSYVDGAGVAA